MHSVYSTANKLPNVSVCVRELHNTKMGGASVIYVENFSATCMNYYHYYYYYFVYNTRINFQLPTVWQRDYD